MGRSSQKLNDLCQEGRPLTLGDRLLEIRILHGFTLDMLSNRSVISEPFLSKLENDKSLPSRATLEAILTPLVEVTTHDKLEILVLREKTMLEQRGFEGDVAEFAARLFYADTDARKRIIGLRGAVTAQK